MTFDRNTYVKEQFTKLIAIEETVTEKVFDECVFSECTLSSTRFEKCRFINCLFTKCDLSNLVPMNGEFREIKFKDCKAIGIDWTRATVMKGISFSDCLLNYCNFRFRKLPKVVMKKCEVKEADFIEADLSDGNFRHSDFEKTVFFKTNLTKADFTGATNYSIDVINNTIKNARFSLPDALSLLDNLDITVE